MEYLDNQYYHKYKLITFILESNKESNNIFFRERKLLSRWLMLLKKDSFFNAIVLLNFNSFSGYFSLQYRKTLNDIVVTEDFEKFKNIIENYKFEYLGAERLAHNLWLARLILANDKYEWKYLVEARKRFINEAHIINFKNKVKINNKVYDLNTILLALIQNKLKFKHSDKKWLLDKYSQEIKLIKYYLEEELASEITDEGIN